MNRFTLALALTLCLAAPCAAQRAIVKGSTDQTTSIRIVDSADGTPETGVVAATSGLDLEYVRLGAAPTDLTESDLAATDSAHSDGGIKHLGNGIYRVDLPDAAVATGVNEVLVTGACTGMVIIPTKHALWDFSPYTATPAVNVTQIEGADASDLLNLRTRGYKTVTTIGTSDNAETIIEAASAGTLIIFEPVTHTINAVVAVPTGVHFLGYGATITGDPGGGTDSIFQIAGNNRWEGIKGDVSGTTGNGHFFGTVNNGTACDQTFVNCDIDGSDDTFAFLLTSSGRHRVSYIGGVIRGTHWDGFTITGPGDYDFHGVQFLGNSKLINIFTGTDVTINYVCHDCSFQTTGTSQTDSSNAISAFVALGSAKIRGQVVNCSYQGVSYPALLNSGTSGSATLEAINSPAFTTALCSLTNGATVTNVQTGIRTKTDFLPSATAGSNGGLPTVDGSNRIAGMQGTLTSLDALDTAQDAQHTNTMNRLGAPAGASVSADNAATLAQATTAATQSTAGAADAATAIARLTATRAAYLDKLNITGNVASSGEVTTGSFIAVDPDVIDASRTWNGEGSRATNIITVADNFAGTFALKPDLNNSIISPAGGSVTATITGAATVTPASYGVNRDYTKAHITVPTLTTTGTYVVTVKTVTVDGQTIYTTCTLKVQ